MRIDLTRWPLLLGAALSIAGGVWLLTTTDVAGDKQFAAFTLILIGAVLVGAFVREGGRDQ